MSGRVAAGIVIGIIALAVVGVVMGTLNLTQGAVIVVASLILGAAQRGAGAGR